MAMKKQVRGCGKGGRRDENRSPKADEGGWTAIEAHGWSLVGTGETGGGRTPRVLRQAPRGGVVCVSQFGMLALAGGGDWGRFRVDQQGRGESERRGLAATGGSRQTATFAALNRVAVMRGGQTGSEYPGTQDYEVSSEPGSRQTGDAEPGLFGSGGRHQVCVSKKAENMMQCGRSGQAQ